MFYEGILSHFWHTFILDLWRVWRCSFSG